jgi:hypothetical protein
LTSRRRRSLSRAAVLSIHAQATLVVGHYSTTTDSCQYRNLQFQEYSTITLRGEQMGQRLISGCRQQPSGRNAALGAIHLSSKATDQGRGHQPSSCTTGSMLLKRPILAPPIGLLELAKDRGLSEFHRTQSGDKGEGAARSAVSVPPHQAGDGVIKRMLRRHKIPLTLPRYFGYVGHARYRRIDDANGRAQPSKGSGRRPAVANDYAISRCTFVTCGFP